MKVFLLPPLDPQMYVFYLLGKQRHVMVIYVKCVLYNGGWACHLPKALSLSWFFCQASSSAACDTVGLMVMCLFQHFL